eukprot:6208492-Pleurochrysis_carterae.AAC.1
MHARRALSKRERGACLALQRISLELRAICPQKSGGRPPQGKAESQEGGKNLAEAPQKSEKQKEAEKKCLAGESKSRWFATGMGGGRKKAEELDGAGGVFAR